MITCKKDVDHRDESSRVVPASQRLPTGFASNPQGTYPCFLSQTFEFCRSGKFSLLGSKPVAGQFWELYLNGFGAQPPSDFSGQLVTRREYTECRGEIIRVVPASRLMHD